MSGRTMTPLELKLAQAYRTLISQHPFFATILLRLVRIEDPTQPTAWTDGKRLGYNPKFVMELPQEELVGVLAHEVMHVAGLHPWRRQWREPRAWNIACDKVVNHIVTEAARQPNSGMALPKWVIPGVPDKSAEELYEPLPPGCDGGGEDPRQSGQCGDVCDAKNPDGTELTEAESHLQQSEAKIVVQQALNAAKKAGKLPAGLERWIEDLLEPKVPWRELLSQFIAENAKHDYSWTRPNRRFMQSGIMMPSLHSPSFGKVVLGCDTSGSIDQAQLKDICSEVLGCLELYEEKGDDPQLTVAWFDHDVYPQVISDAADLAPKGGGGTSYAPVMAWLGGEAEKPRALIMVTDGYCNDFGEQPECPVLWILTQKNKAFQPPFGEIAFTLNESE